MKLTPYWLVSFQLPMHRPHPSGPRFAERAMTQGQDWPGTVPSRTGRTQKARSQSDRDSHMTVEALSFCDEPERCSRVSS